MKHWKQLILSLSGGLLLAATIFGQSGPVGTADAGSGAVPGPAEAERPRPPESREAQPVMGTFGPQSEVLEWRGKRFGIGDPQLARARFEKYLNAAPATDADDLAYDELLEEISARLRGSRGGRTTERITEAWRLLYVAAEHPVDSRLSETLADRVISFWQTNVQIRELLSENRRLEQEIAKADTDIRGIRDLERRDFIEMTRGKSGLEGGPPSLDYRAEPEERRRAERMEQIEENRQAEVTSRLNQRLEFQSMILQFFTQRRFQHAMIASDFYRYIFPAEESELQGSDALKADVFGGLDIKLTTTTLDALSKEAIQDVESSIETVSFLLDQGEVDTAARRLMEAFQLGEFLPAVKTFPLEPKRRIYEYVRVSERLSSALEVRDFARAEKLLAKASELAEDFDPTRPRAFLATATRLSDLALQKATNAALRGDSAGVEAAVAEAVRHWPTNPRIETFSASLIERVDQRSVASRDFDRLLEQGNERAIFADRFRLAVALAEDPERNEAFLAVMQRMEEVEAAMAQARELDRIGNAFGAWEILERAYRRYSTDPELNRMRGDFAMQAAAFAAVVARAESLESRDDLGGALQAYLEAETVFPASYFATSGIERTVERILNHRSGVKEGDRVRGDADAGGD